MAAELFLQFPNSDALGSEFGLGAVGAGPLLCEGCNGPSRGRVNPCQFSMLPANVEIQHRAASSNGPSPTSSVTAWMVASLAVCDGLVATGLEYGLLGVVEFRTGIYQGSEVKPKADSQLALFASYSYLPSSPAWRMMAWSCRSIVAATFLMPSQAVDDDAVHFGKLLGSEVIDPGLDLASGGTVVPA